MNGWSKIGWFFINVKKNLNYFIDSTSKKYSMLYSLALTNMIKDIKTVS